MTHRPSENHSVIPRNGSRDKVGTSVLGLLGLLGLFLAAVALLFAMGWAITGGGWIVGVGERGINAVVLTVVFGFLAALCLLAARHAR